MEPQGNINQIKTPWGAPASRSTPPTNTQSQSNSFQQNPFSNDRSYQHNDNRTPNSYHHQRPSPYRSDRGRNIRMDNSSNTFQNNRKQNDSPTSHPQGQNFSPRNPFTSKGTSFSSDNPFQSKGHNFSPANPFQNKGECASPNQQALMQPAFPASPLSRTPGAGNHSFSPRTPGFYTPSPRNFGHQRNSSGSSRQYGQQNNNRGNPGGSNNISHYINPSMLEDPWKDLPPVPIRPY